MMRERQSVGVARLGKGVWRKNHQLTRKPLAKKRYFVHNLSSLQYINPVYVMCVCVGGGFACEWSKGMFPDLIFFF